MLKKVAQKKQISKKVGQINSHKKMNKRSREENVVMQTFAQLFVGAKISVFKVYPMKEELFR